MTLNWHEHEEQQADIERRELRHQQKERFGEMPATESHSETYQTTLAHMRDPQDWDVSGLIEDVRSNLFERGEDEALAVIDFLLERANAK